MLNDFTDRYFLDVVEYPDDVLSDILPWGVLYEYISSTFLDGLVNYATPIALYSLGRYTCDDEIVGSDGETKKSLRDKIISGEHKSVHTKLNLLRDDVVLLSHIAEGQYILFILDMDVSDCYVGRFKATDEEEIISFLRTSLNDHNSTGEKVVKGYDNGIQSAQEMPLTWARGWVSFF